MVFLTDNLSKLMEKGIFENHIKFSYHWSLIELVFIREMEDQLGFEAYIRSSRQWENNTIMEKLHKRSIWVN